MNKDTKRAARVIGNSRLAGLTAEKFNARRLIGSASETGRVAAEIVQTAKAGGLDQGRFLVTVGFKLRVVPADSAETLVEIRCTYQLRYKAPEDFEASARELNAFARTNGTFNAWPFFREFASSSLSRLGLPVLTLPLIRFGDSSAPGKPA